MRDWVDRFRQSMGIDYMKWHDGIGYDLEAIDEMNDKDRRAAERLIVAKGVTDWRDLEALERIGTPSALSHIFEARDSDNAELRLRAHGYGPPADSPEREEAIVRLLGVADVYGGLSHALDEALEYPTPKVVGTLVLVVRDRPGAPAYNAAATLYCIHGKIDSPYSFENRPFLLQFSEQDSPARQAAFDQMVHELGLKVP